MTTEYEKKGDISRTVRRPVRDKEPLGLVDRQALPPYRWCALCGGEVYRQNETLCPDCKEEK